MKRTAIVALVLALEGCALGRHLVNVPLRLAGASVVPMPYRPEWGGPKHRDELTPEERAEWSPIFNRDNAHCYAQGSALSTWSASGAWSGGSGVASGGSRFNEGVYLSCMNARGWAYSGYTLVY